MADTESSDESSSFSQSNESDESNQEDAPTRDKKFDGKASGRDKKEHERIKGKQYAQNEDEQASPEHSPTTKKNKSVKDETKVNLKSVDEKIDQQQNRNPTKANRLNRGTPSQLSDEFDYQDHQNGLHSTAAGPSAKYDSPPHVKKSKNNKTKTKVSEERRERSLSDIGTENRKSNSKTKTRTNENKLNYSDSERDKKRENSFTGNNSITHRPPKQQERTNKEGRTSNVASESLEWESSESDCATAEHERRIGRKMTSEGSVTSIKGHKSRSSDNHTHINKSNKVHCDENRDRDMGRSNKTKHYGETDDLQRRNYYKPDESKEKIDDQEYGYNLHRNSNNVTQGASGTNKKKHSKICDTRSQNIAKNEISRTPSDRSSSCSSSGCSSSGNDDKNPSRRSGAGRRVESHIGSSIRSSSSGNSFSSIDKCDDSSRNSTPSSQGRLRSTAQTTTNKNEKKSHDTKETDSGRASKTSYREDSGRTSGCKSKKSHNEKETDRNLPSKTSQREDTTERTSDRKSKKSHDKKETDSNRSSKTSQREDSSERTSDRKSIMAHDKKETDSNRSSKTSQRKDMSERTSDRKSKKSRDKKETDSNRSSKTSQREDSSERTSDRKSKKSHDLKETDSNRPSKTSQREDSSERTSDRKSQKSHDRKETDGNRSSKTSQREESSERASGRKSKKSHNKKNESNWSAKTSQREDSSESTSGRKSKKSHDKKETDGNRSSKTSRRKDSSERASDRKSKKSHDRKETDSNRSSKTSHRDDRSERTSDRKSKKSHENEEADCKKTAKSDKSRRNEKIYVETYRRRSESRGSSSEPRRSHSKEKGRDKERQRAREKHEHRNKGSERYRSSIDYHSRKTNGDRNPADEHKRNARETYRARPHSRNHSGERWNGGRESSDFSIDSARYRDSPEKREGYRPKYYHEDSIDRGSKYEQPNDKYEWQFENEHGTWITYGQSNSGKPLQGDDVVTSDAIEEFFSEHPGTKKPLLIEANKNRYFLDFIEMNQINVKTSVRRRIRRVRRPDKHSYQSQNYFDDNHYGDARDNDLAPSNFGGLSSRLPHPKDHQPTRKNDTKFEWQFEDETGNWITYGKTNSAKDLSAGPSTTSDDIEKYHARDPLKASMQIRSGREQYLLNFKQLTEVNIETLGHRRVRRVPKSSGAWQTLTQWLGWNRYSSSGSKDTDVVSYEWQFQDERGVWITYGQASSNGITAFSTAASSDDIEAYYSNSPDKAPIIISSRTHTYVLDFKNMVQINQETLVPRPIQRVKKTAKDSNANPRAGVGQNAVTAGNGTNAAVNNFFNPYQNPVNFGHGAGNVHPSFTQGGPRVNVGATWQFQDETGTWITYGQPSSTNQTAGSTTTSDDIEQYFSTNPGKTRMTIQSPLNRYVLDKPNMIQINVKTQAQKPVRRIMKQNIQPPLNVQQGF